MTCEKCAYLEIHDAVVRDNDRALDLLRRAETEMRYAGWNKYESDNSARNGVYEQIKQFLETHPAAQRQWVGLTKTVVGNHLRRHALGDQSTFRQGFKEGVAFAELKLKELNK
jgi:hypothetical protein